MATAGKNATILGTRRLLLQYSRSSCPARVQQQQQASVRWSSSQKPNPGGNNLLWHAATIGAFGLSFVGVRYALQNMNLQSDEENGGVPSTDSIEPAAEVTSKVFFDVAIDQHPAGRIVLGLYGGVVPKTATNFQKLCEGTEQNGGRTLSYQGSIFHRIIPGFMVSCM
jgi:Cyclophilin type peptidyl-prolyl cis-trans isomerase/CLD